MRALNFKRALSFSLLLYVCTSVIFVLLSLIFGIEMDAKPSEISTMQCITYWIISVPIILVLSKWYFKRFQPSMKRGLCLGILAIIISFLLDSLMIALTMSAGASIEMFVSMYSDWKFYVMVILVIATTAYAGFEFDRTYTFEDGAMRKK